MVLIFRSIELTVSFFLFGNLKQNVLIMNEINIIDVDSSVDYSLKFIKTAQRHFIIISESQWTWFDVVWK